MSLEFVPPREDAKELPRYASYVVGSGMKLHTSIGHAKNSLSYRGWKRVDDPDWKESLGGYPRRKSVTRRSFILENVNGRWYVLYDIADGLSRDELPWMKEYIHDGWSWRAYTELMKKSEYYQEKISSNSWRVAKKPASMTRDEYVAWRINVELESRGISNEE